MRKTHSGNISRRKPELGRLAAAAGLLAVVVVCGCYHIGVVPPRGIKRIAVPFFSNETFPLERDLEYDLTREVRRRIEEETDLELVSDPAAADAVLEGTLQAFRESVAAEDKLDRPVRSYVYATVSVTLRRGEEVLFQDTWQERTAFLTASGRTSAREGLVRRIADRIVAVALSNWDQ